MTADEVPAAELDRFRARRAGFAVAPAGPDVLGRVHMDPEDPIPALNDHKLLGPLAPEAIDAEFEPMSACGVHTTPNLHPPRAGNIGASSMRLCDRRDASNPHLLSGDR